MVWTRPESVPFPSVWSRFKGRKPLANGKIPSFRVQDVPDELRDRVVDFMCAHFMYEEPTCQSTKLAEDKEAEKDLRKLWYGALECKIALVCLVEDEHGNVPKNPVIAGVNMTTLSSKDDKGEFKGCPKSELVLGSIEFVTKQANVYERYGVNEYMTAYGLSVSKEFRGQNLGYEILKARVPLCKAVGLKLTGTVFTAVVSQVLAARCGFELCYEVSYEDLVDKYHMDLNIKTDSMKYMVLVIS